MKAKENEWISANDRLPKEGQDVLVIRFSQGKYWCPEVCEFKDGYFIGGNNDNDYEYSSPFVTHWMPLPSPPLT